MRSASLIPDHAHDLSEEIGYDEFCDRLRAELETVRGVSSGDFSTGEPFLDRLPRSSPKRMLSSLIIAPKTGLQSSTDFYGIVEMYLRLFFMTQIMNSLQGRLFSHIIIAIVSTSEVRFLLLPQT